MLVVQMKGFFDILFWASNNGINILFISSSIDRFVVVFEFVGSYLKQVFFAGGSFMPERRARLLAISKPIFDLSVLLGKVIFSCDSIVGAVFDG